MTRTLEDLRDLYGSIEPDPDAESRVWSAARTSHQRARTRRRRTVVAAGVVAAVTAAGVGTAAAEGWVPVGLTRLFGAPVPGAYNPEQGSARVLATGATPDGEPLTLWYADANNGGFCLYALLGEAGTAHPPTSDQLTEDHPIDLAGGCTGPKDDPRLQRFGHQVFASEGEGHAMFIDRVPGATRATLTFADGIVADLPVAQGWVAGAFPTSSTQQPPILTGFDADGTQIGQTTISAGSR